MISSPVVLVEVAGRLVGQQHSGLATSARAMAARCISPPESSRGLCLSAVAEADQFEQFCGPAAIVRRVAASSRARSRRSSPARARFPASSVRAAGDRTERSCRSAGCAACRGRRPAGCRCDGLRSRLSPASGPSSVPSRCSSVLLPEPLWPTIARNSPSSIARSTPCSTGMPTGPCDSSCRRSARRGSRGCDACDAYRRASDVPSAAPRAAHRPHARRDRQRRRAMSRQFGPLCERSRWMTYS